MCLFADFTSDIHESVLLPMLSQLCKFRETLLCTWGVCYTQVRGRDGMITPPTWILFAPLPRPVAHRLERSRDRHSSRIRWTMRLGGGASE